MRTTICRPGVTLGSYPQKADHVESKLERLAATLGGFVRDNIRRPAQLQQSFITLVEKEAEGLDSYSDSGLREAIMDLRTRLHRMGINRLDAARGFALVREVAHRTLQQRHFDVQLQGGWLLLNGAIAEMETGEGKTLTATLPASIAALAGEPVHVVTVNDYLVERDASCMAPIYDFLGLTVGSVTESMSVEERRAAYAKDIVYCTNKQLVFDYLRDRLSMGEATGRLRLQLDRLKEPAPLAQPLLLRGLCFAILDEADSVLVDEARTPLVLSKRTDGTTAFAPEVFHQAIDTARELEERRDFVLDRVHREAELTDVGKARIQQLTVDLGSDWVSGPKREELIRQALCALNYFQRDSHYMVKEGRVQIINENTGRTMPDRSWPQNLHQLMEAKEQCEITDPPVTLARISYQRFFRRYLRLAGMSGTAQEVAGELWTLYGLSVAKVPTNRRSCRRHLRGAVYRTLDDKWQAITDRVCELNAEQRPVLIGTRTLEASEALADRLTIAGIPHQVLNARQDGHEAEIVALAGEPGRVTVATNMAGRGTDIKLTEASLEAGGLHVIVTELHDARRVDRQLVGRCARQGDPGTVEFVLSIEDTIGKTCPPWFLNNVFGPAIAKERPLRNPLARWLLGYLQTRMERRHYKVRRQLAHVDERLNDLLAFSGKPE